MQGVRGEVAGGTLDVCFDSAGGETDRYTAVSREREIRDKRQRVQGR